MIKTDELDIKAGKGFPLGVSDTGNGVQFSVAFPYVKDCKLILYNKLKKTDAVFIELDKTYKVGDIFSCIICADDIRERLMREYEYMYEVNGMLYADPYAKLIKGRERFGKKSKGIRCGFDFCEYIWEDEKRPGLSYDEMIIYRMHIRGFTKHRSSGVMNRGTFAGVSEKADYLQKLGVNAVLLLPAYDFNEIMDDSDAYGIPEYVPDEDKGVREENIKVNYWGYTGDCAYFAPKASYASEPGNCIKEFKDMVNALHKAGIEVLLDIHFAAGMSHGMILDCLRYWVYEYHIDGFKINSDVACEKLVKSDETLKSVKFLACYWKRENIDGRLADYNDRGMINIRRFILGEEGQAAEYAANYEPLCDGCAGIQYAADINGFTLMDSVSYERKHNDANGENGTDGTDYNYSSNYGVEGSARKKDINEMRHKQIRNALTLLFASLKTPMLLAGDEFGNSQKGNNNAYCQDNAVSWLDWGLLKKNEKLFEYVKRLIRIRKEYIIGKKNNKIINNDMPDISFHGVLPWITDFAPYSRVLGIMLSGCGIYIAINMNKYDEMFQLPILSNDVMWEDVIYSSGKPETEWERGIQKSVVPAGSVVIYRSMKKEGGPAQVK